jgi:hypothetical protein
MPGFLLHVGAAVQCFHEMGVVTTVTTQPRVRVSGMDVATVANVYQVLGCLFQVATPAGPKPQPCVTVKWAMPAAQVKVMGLPVLLNAVPGSGPGSGVCLPIEALPQGQPKVALMQLRVQGR